MGRKVTAADVAREAGVSAATVDRVLNHRGGVNEEKEKRVLAAARRLRLDRSLDMRAARTLRVAAFLQPSSNPYHGALKTALSVENHGPNPFNIQTRIFDTDPDTPTTTLKGLRGAVTSHDAVITCVPHDDELAEYLDLIAERGIPVVTLATDIRAQHAKYVGPDNYRAGRVAGELVGRLTSATGGDVLVIVGLMSMLGQTERYSGFSDVLAERFPNHKIVNVLESHEEGARAGALAYSALNDNPKIIAIYNASAGAVPIAHAIETLGHVEEVVFVTHELTEQRRELLRTGRIDAVIDQEPEMEIALALKVIAGAFGRLDPMPSSTETPLRIYLRENC